MNTPHCGRIAILMLACCLAWAPGAVPSAAAQSLAWDDISGLWGFSSLYELGDGTLYAIEENVLYRSFDGGESWQAFPRPGGPILEFAARGSTTVIAIRRNATLYKQYFLSTDRGDTWTRITTESDPVHFSLMLSPDGIPCALYLVGPKLAFERLVNGAWERLGVPSGAYGGDAVYRLWTLSAIDESGAFYIGTTADGIHSSRDNGQTWTKALPYRYVSNIAFAPGGRSAIGTMPNGRTNGGAFVSDDHGASWNTAGLTDLYMFGMEFNAAGDLLVLGTRTSATAVYRLNSGSAAWDSTAPFDFDYGTMHRTRAGKYIVTSQGLGLLVSTDDGVHWTPEGVRRQEVYSLATAPDGSLLAGTTGRGIFRTTDSGNRWGRSAGGPDDPTSFYALLTVETTMYAGTEKGLYATPDNGSTWTPVLQDGFDPDTGYISVYTMILTPAGDLLVGTGAGLFRRHDGGSTWEPSGLASSAIRSLALAGDGTIYAATGTKGVFSSADGGSSWTPRGLVRPDLQCVAVSDAGRVFVGVSGGLYFSADAGATWTQKIFTSGHVESILFNGEFNIFAGTSYGLFASSNAGQSWTPAGFNGAFVSALVYDHQHSIVAALYKTGVSRTAGIVTALDDPPALPSSPSLSQNYPNPFNPVTTIAYGVPSFSRVTLRVYDLLGRVSETLVSGDVPPGEYRAVWNAGGRPSGVYYSVIVIEPLATGTTGPEGRAYREVRKMLLMK